MSHPSSIAATPRLNRFWDCLGDYPAHHCANHTCRKTGDAYYGCMVKPCTANYYLCNTCLPIFEAAHVCGNGLDIPAFPRSQSLGPRSQTLNGVNAGVLNPAGYKIRWSYMYPHDQVHDRLTCPYRFTAQCQFGVALSKGEQAEKVFMHVKEVHKDMHEYPWAPSSTDPSQFACPFSKCDWTHSDWLSMIGHERYHEVTIGWWCGDCFQTMPKGFQNGHRMTCPARVA